MQTKKGFTIIELMLSMSMMSVLLLAVFAMVAQMQKILTRGNTYRNINAAARTINDDFTRQLNSTRDQMDWGSRDEIRTTGLSYNDRSDPNGAAICTGKDTYIFSKNVNGATKLRYAGGGEIGLARVSDPSRSYCQASARINDVVQRSQATELLNGNDSGIWIYSLNMMRVATDAQTNQSLIEIEYILSTSDISVGGRGGCDLGLLNNEYCGAARFNLLVRTLGG